jgi:hypothetical protein
MTDVVCLPHSVSRVTCIQTANQSYPQVLGDSPRGAVLAATRPDRARSQGPRHRLRLAQGRGPGGGDGRHRRDSRAGRRRRHRRDCGRTLAAMANLIGPGRAWGPWGDGRNVHRPKHKCASRALVLRLCFAKCASVCFGNLRGWVRSCFVVH